MKKVVGGGLAVLLVVGIVFFTDQNQEGSKVSEHVAEFGDVHTVTLYKDPSCGCCTGYAEALRRHGFIVDIQEVDDMQTIKQAHDIPLMGESCHTSVVNDYVIEGHVPLVAVTKLLTEQPDISGIGLPSMPIGTPGMPGMKTSSYEVYQLSADGEMTPYLTI